MSFLPCQHRAFMPSPGSSEDDDAASGVPTKSSWQRQHEAAAAAVARLAAHAAAVALGDLLDQAQAQADAAGLLGVAGQAVERLEDALAQVVGHAGTAVADTQLD